MTADLYPLQVLLVTLAGWVNRQQQHVIEYLVEENRVLKGQLEGRRPRVTDDQRRRLAVKGRFRHILQSAGVRIVLTPVQAPNANAYAERFVRSIREECLDRLIFFGERRLLRALDAFVAPRCVAVSGWAGCYGTTTARLEHGRSFRTLRAPPIGPARVRRPRRCVQVLPHAR